MSKEDEYRFYPEDFDGEDDPTDRDIDVAPVVIVGCLGVGVALFLANPFVDPIVVSGVELELAVLAAAVFSVGLLVGSGVYVREGRLRLGVVHAVGAIGWFLLVVGTAFSSTPALVGGGIVLVFGAVALVALTVRS